MWEEILKKKGLWANIHAKRERGEKPARLYPMGKRARLKMVEIESDQTLLKEMLTVQGQIKLKVIGEATQTALTT